MQIAAADCHQLLSSAFFLFDLNTVGYTAVTESWWENELWEKKFKSTERYAKEVMKSVL